MSPERLSRLATRRFDRGWPPGMPFPPAAPWAPALASRKEIRAAARLHSSTVLAPDRAPDVVAYAATVELMLAVALLGAAVLICMSAAKRGDEDEEDEDEKDEGEDEEEGTLGDEGQSDDTDDSGESESGVWDPPPDPG